MRTQVLDNTQILKGLYITAILATISLLGCGDSPVYDESIVNPIEQLRDPNAEVRSQAADVLVNIGEPAVPALINALDDKEMLTRYGAVVTLAEMGASAGPEVPALIKRLKDKIPLVRSTAALALGMIEATTEEAVLALLEVMDNAFMHGYAISAFGEMGEPVVPELTKATNHKHHHIRANATIALQLFRRPIASQQ